MEMLRWKKCRWLACKGLFQENIIYLFILLTRELHREQLSIEHSIQDIDNAVGKLDNILISIFVFVAIIIIAVALVNYSSFSFCLATFIKISRKLS
jgi:hypothetical protein